MNELANNVTIQYCNISQGQNYPQARRRGDRRSATPATRSGRCCRRDRTRRSASAQPLRPPEGPPAARRHRGRQADRRRRRRVQRLPQQRLLQLARHGGQRRGGAAEPEQLRRQLLPGRPRRRQPVGGSSTAITTRGGTGIFNGSNATRTKVYHSGNLKDINKDGDASDGTALANTDFGSSRVPGRRRSRRRRITASPTRAAVAYNSRARLRGRALVEPRRRRRAHRQRDARRHREDHGVGGRSVQQQRSEGTEWRALVRDAGDVAARGLRHRRRRHARRVGADARSEPAAADNNGDFDADGYTNLEEYINEVAAWPATAALMLTAAPAARAPATPTSATGASAASRGSGSRATSTWRASAPATRWSMRPGNMRGAWTSMPRRVGCGGHAGHRGRLARRRRAAGGRRARRTGARGRAARGWRAGPGARRAGSRRRAAVAWRRCRARRRPPGRRAARARARAPRAGDSWTLLTAAGGITGRFRSVPAGYEVTVAGARVTLTFRGAPAYVAAR